MATTTPDSSPTPASAAATDAPDGEGGGRELLVDFILSLDGCAAGEGWPGWWGLESPEYLEWLAAEPERIGLMGANTYRLMADMAGKAPGPDVSEEEKASFAQLDSAEQIVFSATLEEPLAWSNTRLVRTDAIAAVRELKRTATKPLTTVGSIRLSLALIEAGLVDRFRVVLFPVVTGRTGLERIWEQFGDLSLELLEARTFEGGLQLLEYRPTVLEPPPGTGWER
ncbi:dihydrofolate reductase family protein [Brachybacterium squillarum]|uniref:dihydrofolate reductase family protein n=1 Tax=Brachybacterium squillarum TaxID=661979 RepID=UPI0022217EAB|nr:dihydrofolate reductase family protein [Brachybacterium squillarum]MCW1804442.1 dihydrofolate reductase family protein [Brachybacterium squillarum]